jgi:hypothetical protein
MIRGHLRRIVLLASLLGAGTAAPALAQPFISPFIGTNFDGDAACPAATVPCARNQTVGLAFGSLNQLIGFEEDVAYAKNLFKDGRLENSSVLSLMSNVLVGPRIGVARPYAGGGFGLLRTQTTFSPASLIELSNTDLGWNIGGGVIVAHNHIGLRADVRMFHGFSDLKVLGFPVSNLELDYGRAVIGIVVQ